MSTSEDGPHDLLAEMSSHHVLQSIDHEILFPWDSQPGVFDGTEVPQAATDAPKSSAIHSVLRPQTKAQYDFSLDGIANAIESEKGVNVGVELFRESQVLPRGLETLLSGEKFTVADTAADGNIFFEATCIPNIFFGPDQSIGPFPSQDQGDQSRYRTGAIPGSRAGGKSKSYGSSYRMITDAETLLLPNKVGSFADNSFRVPERSTIVDIPLPKDAVKSWKRRRAQCKGKEAAGPHLSSSGKVAKMRRESPDTSQLSRAATIACSALLIDTSGSKPSDRRILALSQAFNAPLHLFCQWFHKDAECFREDVRDQTTRSTESDLSQELRNNQRKCRAGAAGSCAKPWIKDPDMPYFCTRCGRKFKRKGDWKKHEELNFPQEFWFCRLLPCQTESMEKRTYLRKDKFRNHLTKRHDVVPTNEHLEACRCLVESEFPRICISRHCSKEFSTWNERVVHITDHMRKPWTFSEWKDFDDDTGEENKLRSSTSDTSEDACGSDTSNNDSEYSDDAPDNGPDGPGNSHDFFFGAENKSGVDHNSSHAGQGSSNQAPRGGALGANVNQQYCQGTSVEETSMSHDPDSTSEHALHVQRLSRQLGERLFVSARDIHPRQSGPKVQAPKDTLTANYVKANVETKITPNADNRRTLGIDREKELEATTISPSSLHPTTKMRQRQPLVTQMVQLQQPRDEPSGYSMRRYLEANEDTLHARLFAGVARISSTRGYQSDTHNKLHHRESGTSMLPSRNPNFAALACMDSFLTHLCRFLD